MSEERRRCGTCRDVTVHNVTTADRAVTLAEIGTREVAALRMTVAVCLSCGFVTEHTASLGHDGEPIESWNEGWAARYVRLAAQP